MEQGSSFFWHVRSIEYSFLILAVPLTETIGGNLVCDERGRQRRGWIITTKVQQIGRVSIAKQSRNMTGRFRSVTAARAWYVVPKLHCYYERAAVLESRRRKPENGKHHWDGCGICLTASKLWLAAFVPSNHTENEACWLTVRAQAAPGLEKGEENGKAFLHEMCQDKRPNYLRSDSW